MPGIKMIKCGVDTSLVPFHVLRDTVEDADGFEEVFHVAQLLYSLDSERGLIRIDLDQFRIALRHYLMA